MQIKNFLLCVMVYLVPVCLDAQIPGDALPAMRQVDKKFGLTAK
jgi:hypothetical protein